MLSARESARGDDDGGRDSGQVGTTGSCGASGQASDVPVIAGFANDESGHALRQASSAAEYRAIAREVFGAGAAEFLELYPVAEDDAVAEVAKTVAREGGVMRTARNWAKVHRPTRLWTGDDRGLSQQMTASLMALANADSPSTTDLEWPAWSAGGGDLLEIGAADPSVHMHTGRLDFTARAGSGPPVEPRVPAGIPRD